MWGFAAASGEPPFVFGQCGCSCKSAIDRGSFSPGAVNMITQREVAILIDAIRKHAGLDIPPDVALTALYAVADHNYRLIPQKPGVS
jgi:hypothetical protein